MPWERLVWLLLPLLCGSKCFLSVLLKVWESLWRLIADKITEQVSRNVSGKGSKPVGMMLIYALLTFVVLMVGARTLALLFVDTTELEILKNTELFLHVSAYFFPFLGLLCILRYTIQGAGYTNLAMLSGVSEMIARTLVSIYAVPVYGYIAVCFGDPTAWLAADLFLIPAFIYVYRKLKELRCPLTEG